MPVHWGARAAAMEVLTDIVQDVEAGGDDSGVGSPWQWVADTALLAQTVLRSPLSHLW